MKLRRTYLNSNDLTSIKDSPLQYIPGRMYLKVEVLEESSNFKIVKVKKERACRLCRDVILEGAKSYSISPYKNPRYWVCLNCLPEPNKSIIHLIKEDDVFFGKVERPLLPCLTEHDLTVDDEQYEGFLRDDWKGNVERKILEDISEF